MRDENGAVLRLLEPRRVTRKLLASPGVWVSAAELEGGVTDAPELPRYLRRMEAGAPLPDGVAPGAARYEMIVRNELPVAFRRPAALAGAVVTVASMALVLAGVPWGLVALPVGLGLVIAGWWGGTQSVTFRRADTGAWVEDDAAIPSDEPFHWFGTGTRVFAGALSALALWLAATGAGEMSWAEILMTGALGLGLGACALVDSLPFPRRDLAEEIRSHERFRELADPARALTPDDVALRPAGAAVPAPAADDPSHTGASVGPGSVR